MDLLYTQLTQIESLIWQLKYIYLHGHTMDRLVIHVLINNQRISFSCCQDIDILLWASQRAIKKNTCDLAVQRYLKTAIMSYLEASQLVQH